jgi:hypothetical protein
MKNWLITLMIPFEGQYVFTKGLKLVRSLGDGKKTK